MFFESVPKNTFYELLINEADFTLDLTETSKKQSEKESRQSKASKESEVANNFLAYLPIPLISDLKSLEELSASHLDMKRAASDPEYVKEVKDTLKKYTPNIYHKHQKHHSKP